MAPISKVITDGNGLDFNFSRVINNEERRMVIELVQVLDQAHPLSVGADEFRCKFAVGNRFSARECYIEAITGEVEI
ncbi:hypothetical protein BVC80_9017g46 [Macleaya cordata]|uniref:Uncharacterized protein n=1 Tax=Macleaya cordata TaxID=56857 RepID=A0A200QQG7_MACCD|nr:hypothetical protein BVC80_9017g46 [Macleaya cordata]